VRFFVKLRSLKPPGRRALLQAAVMIPLTALGLRLFGFRRVYSGLDRLAKRGRQGPPNDEPLRVRRARHVTRYLAQNGPYRGNCLSRSLVLWWSLRRQGIDNDLRIGVRNGADSFQAHAWVEYQGQPLNAGRLVHQQYAAFDRPIVPEGAEFS
jgi:hypothetical protein